MLIKPQNYLGSNHQGRVSYFPDSVVKETGLPARFTFPFWYEPHPLTKIAAAELQHYLESQTGLGHNFGLTDSPGYAIGKMFGVLVVEDTDGRVGYLSACSGKLAGSNDHPKFVPPVFDMLTENSFFLKEQEVIDAINRKIEGILADESYHRLKAELEQLSARSLEEISAFKRQMKSNKAIRAQRRVEMKNALSEHDYTAFEADLVKQSHHDQYLLKVLSEGWKQRIDEARANWLPLDESVEALKNERKERSAALQQQLFEQYAFLDQAGNSKSLHDIFAPTAFGRPPSGAGECATPKLLQYAFANGYRPVAMAEFWWGATPRSEIRKHKQFYPACSGKCKPILAHMLDGLPVDENPFLVPAKDTANLEIVYQDDWLLVVNKPAGLRSVPGVDIEDSVYSRLRSTLPHTGLFMVHRLDMGTSGLLVVAKTPEVHKHIQKQFLDRVVSKRYTALLSRVINSDEGEIRLPLRMDPYNRPMQLVCFETGKKSITRWKVVERHEGSTKVHFWPLTGRTHQLRMHAAHELGLNAPIVGDDLYGSPGTRLCLHAAHLSFIHPETKERISFELAEDF